MSSTCPLYRGEPSVLYRCSCGRGCGLSELFLCRHCTHLRCRLCASHEAETYFCAVCQDSQSAYEAHANGSRCRNCFDCPHCGTTLTVRAMAVAASIDATASFNSSTDQAPKIKKVYFSTCTFCRWSTRDAGIADQDTAIPKGWKRKNSALSPSPDQTDDGQTPQTSHEISLNYYRALVANEKAEVDKLRRLEKRRTLISLTPSRYTHLLQRVGGKSVAEMSPRRKLLAGCLTSADLHQSTTNKEVVAPEWPVNHGYDATNDELPRDFDSVLSLDQRARYCENVPGIGGDEGVDAHNLFPLGHPLTAKWSLRCRPCDRIVCRQDPKPGQSEFKIHQCASFYVPEVRLLKRTSDAVLLTMTNPVMERVIDVHLSKLECESNGCISPVTLPVKNLSLAPKPVEFLSLPLDDTSNTGNRTSADPELKEYVIAELENKSIVRLPLAQCDVEDKEKRFVAFNMKYSYKHLISATAATVAASIGSDALSSLSGATSSDMTGETKETTELSVPVLVRL